MEANPEKSSCKMSLPFKPSCNSPNFRTFVLLRLKCLSARSIFGDVAQSVEHQTENLGVGGSSPPVTTKPFHLTSTFP